VDRVFDPTDPAFVDDPYPVFARLRRDAPVQRLASGAWALTRYADVHEALTDERLSNAPARYAVVAPRNRERYVCADVAANIIPFLDAPTHDAPRRALGRGFHERLRSTPPDIAGIASRLLSEWDAGGHHDVVADYASPLAVAVIGDLLGVPTDDAERLQAWSELFFYLFGAIPSADVRDSLDTALTDFRHFFARTIEVRRSEPDDGLISRWLGDTRNGALTDGQLVDNLMLLFADGVENVDRAIGVTAHTLLAHPSSLARVRTDSRLLSDAVTECLRFESPGQYIGRVAREDVEYGGVTIPRGAVILLVLGSANRDESHFPGADRFDIDRTPNAHLAFGRGPHSCIGGPLVELEVKVALEVLLRRFPGMELVTERASWITRPGHRWIERVDVRV